MFNRNKGDEALAHPQSASVVDLLAFRVSRSSARLVEGLHLVRQVQSLELADVPAPVASVESLGTEAARKLQTLQRIAMITDHDLYQKWLGVSLNPIPVLRTVKSH